MANSYFDTTGEVERTTKCLKLFEPVMVTPEQNQANLDKLRDSLKNIGADPSVPWIVIDSVDGELR